MRVQCRRPVTGLRPSGRRSRPLRLRSRRAAQVKLPVKAPNVARHSSATCSASDSVEESGSARRSEGQDVGVPIIPNVAAEWAPDSASGLQMNHQLMTGLTLTTLFGEPHSALCDPLAGQGCGLLRIESNLILLSRLRLDPHMTYRACVQTFCVAKVYILSFEAP